jgi:hypothetical protein
MCSIQMHQILKGHHQNSQQMEMIDQSFLTKRQEGVKRISQESGVMYNLMHGKGWLWKGKTEVCAGEKCDAVMYSTRLSNLEYFCKKVSCQPLDINSQGWIVSTVQKIHKSRWKIGSIQKFMRSNQHVGKIMRSPSLAKKGKKEKVGYHFTSVRDGYACPRWLLWVT